jgi:pimeloyl-ACP methyl ester carboxylesterase
MIDQAASVLPGDSAITGGLASPAALALPGPGLTKLRPPVDPRSMVSRSPQATIGLNEVSFPGVRMPDRTRDIDSHGVRIRVLEWGSPDAPPLLLAHGGMDFALTYGAFAPLLADGGWRVVSWDQRCHGDSDWAPMSGWASDIRDAAAVLDATSTEPLPILGHSKGGNLIVRLAEAWPHRFSHVVNIDGLPSTRTHGAAELTDEDRTERLAVEVASWLDHRRRTKPDSQRKPGTLEELAKRRAAMNPRLTHEWLCYLASTGAAFSADGWRWKIDPMLRPGGFGPWKPEWAMHGLPGLPMPFLAFLGLEYEAMGWGTQPEDIMRWLPEGGRLIVLEDTGHFVHIEQPGLVSDLILQFLGEPKPAPVSSPSTVPSPNSVGVNL